MLQKLKIYLKQVLGINELETQLKKVCVKSDQESKSINNRLNNLEALVNEDSKDNVILKNHVKFLNSNFSVVSDISPLGYDPSVVVIMKKGNEDVVKTFQFEKETLEEIYRILEGFGKDRNRIDKPRYFPNPSFRF